MSTLIVEASIGREEINVNTMFTFSEMVFMYANTVTNYNYFRLREAIFISTPKIDAKYIPLLVKLGLNVAYYRKLRNLSQEELAEKINLSRTTITNIENADKFNGTSLGTIFKLADAFNIPVKSLFDFRDEHE